MNLLIKVGNKSYLFGRPLQDIYDKSETINVNQGLLKEDSAIHRNIEEIYHLQSVLNENNLMQR